MDFQEAFQIVETVMSSIGSKLKEENYDGLIVKRLESSNTLDANRTTKQSHIAITGPQMDMFPYVRADGYFEVEYAKEDPGLKKYFVAQIPAYIHKENVTYLDSENVFVSSYEELVHISIVRSRRKDAADQVQMSMTYLDSPKYIQFRKAVHTGSYMVMLKRAKTLMYDLYAVKPEDAASLEALNNGFFKLATNTTVKIDDLLPKDKAADYRNLDLEGRKQAFANWMKTLVKPMGKPYSESVIDSYTNALENAGAKLKEFPYEVKNFFAFADDVSFTKAETDAKNTSNFEEIDKKYINHGLSAAFVQYHGFLQSLGEEKSTDMEGESNMVDEPRLKNCLEVQRDPREVTIHALNFIIYGAPGTGKTYSTAEYALAIIENRAADTSKKTVAERKAVMAKYNGYVKNGQIVFTTFHQSYGYEEFIQGLRPNTESEGMAFKTVDGTFKKIADKALNDPDNNYVIIIDEINRANISKVFGELITLIEEDKRWGEVNETCATLQSGDIFAVPNNLYIVGTMNSADKSISLIDAALRRRFVFIEQQPDDSLVEDSILKKVLHEMNLLLAKELDSTDLLVGHSYFMNKTADNLCDIMNNNIIPLLYEYFYDNRKKVASILNEVITKAGANVEIEDSEIGRLRVRTKGGADGSESV